MKRRYNHFSSLPDDWVCPLCHAPKSEFKPEENTNTFTSPNAKRLMILLTDPPAATQNLTILK
ncbi:MAG: hypothetical protein GX897_01075 [Clostridiales bacterium]|nr:hypothetical protein [Clostridiales bacterium]